MEIVLRPDKLQQSINGYSVQHDGETVWAPFALNGAPCRPNGDILSVPEGGRPSQQRFHELALLAINTLENNGIDPTPEKIRRSLVDGSLPTLNSTESNYRGGVDCAGFVYFVLKNYGLNIDEAIAIPPQDVARVIGRDGWRQLDPADANELREKASDKSLSLAEFTEAFHDNYQPQRNVSASRFDYSSDPVSSDNSQPGDIIIYRQSEGISSNHVALVKDVRSNGDLKIAHSGRKSWDSELGGVASFTIRQKNITAFFDKNRGFIELKRINGLKTEVDE